MRNKKDEEAKKAISLTTIEVGQNRKWKLDEYAMKKRQIFPTIVVVLFVITLISTALSMAKYATSKTTNYMNSVSTSKYIWNSNLVTSGTKSGESITGDNLSKTSLLVDDAYYTFHVRNFEAAGAVANVNGEDIVYQIVVTGNLLVTDDSDQSVGASDISMPKNVQTTHEYKIMPDGTSPGIYSGTVTVQSTSPYVKKYVRTYQFELKDVTVVKEKRSEDVYIEIQNGVRDNVVITFTYSDPVFCMPSAISQVTFVKDESVDPHIGRMTLPAGAYGRLQFKALTGTISVSDVSYVIE